MFTTKSHHLISTDPRDAGLLIRFVELPDGETLTYTVKRCGLVVEERNVSREVGRELWQFWAKKNFTPW